MANNDGQFGTLTAEQAAAMIQRMFTAHMPGPFDDPQHDRPLTGDELETLHPGSHVNCRCALQPVVPTPDPLRVKRKLWL